MENHEEPLSIVKYHDVNYKVNKTDFFKKAKDFMQQPSGSNAKYSVHIFRSVIDPMKIDIKKLIESHKDSFRYVSFKTTSVEGFFISIDNQESVNLDFVELQTAVQNLTTSKELSFDDYATLVAIYEDAVQSIVNGSPKPIYGANMERNHLNLPSYLEYLPYNISMSVNKDIDHCVGINIPTYYLGGHHSFSEIHVEDGYLDSANLMHWGVQGAWKGWLIVHPDDNNLLCEIVYEAIKQSKNSKKWQCSTPINHKNIVISPSFLKRNNVRYEIVIQRPGDLLYVDCMIFHQVINFGINLAKAVNVGSSKWNLLANHCIPCACKENKISAIPRNTDIYVTVKSQNANMYFCEVNNCAASFFKKIDYDTHKYAHENSDCPKLTCVTCKKHYVNKESLRKHIARQHVKAKAICSICNKEQSSQNLQRHMRRCKNDTKCPYCTNVFKPSGFGQHKAACSLRPM